MGFLVRKTKNNGAKMGFGGHFGTKKVRQNTK
jgi:hypothetical protein